MQPYFLPYIGYFQLINLVDAFIVYDNIEYTKRGWINRNRFLLNKKDTYITLPLKNASDYLMIGERYISETFDKKKILNQITNAYRKAPFFDKIYLVIEDIINYNNSNLFEFIYNSIVVICTYLDIRTKIVISSTIEINQELKSSQKVLAICKILNADTYINPIGGTGLYSKEEFKKNVINLFFIKTNKIIYKQFDNEFIPWLSILDVMMFNSKDDIKKIINNEFSLI